jgi:hypothetical protein
LGQPAAPIASGLHWATAVVGTAIPDHPEAVPVWELAR